MILLRLFVTRNFRGTCLSVELLKGYMIRERLGTHLHFLRYLYWHYKLILRLAGVFGFLQKTSHKFAIPATNLSIREESWLSYKSSWLNLFDFNCDRENQTRFCSYTMWKILDWSLPFFYENNQAKSKHESLPTYQKRIRNVPAKRKVAEGPQQ